MSILKSKESFRFLKKEKTKNIILLKKDDKFIKLSCEDFFRFFDVEYVPHLQIDKVSILKRIIKNCRKGEKRGVLNQKEIWLGTYYEKEILNGENLNVYIKWISHEKGYGLFALHDLKMGEFIGSYAGMLRKHKRILDKKNSYCFEYQTGLRKTPFTIDAKYIGNHTRFINHSNFPNLDLFNAYLFGITHIVLRTNRGLKKDEELLYDYGENYWKKREKPIF